MSSSSFFTSSFLCHNLYFCVTMVTVSRVSFVDPEPFLNFFFTLLRYIYIKHELDFCFFNAFGSYKIQVRNTGSFCSLRLIFGPVTGTVLSFIHLYCMYVRYLLVVYGIKQCWGSGSAGCACFLASRIRIH
jgi:hypothetical protein